MIVKTIEEWRERAKGLQKFLSLYVIDIQENGLQECNDSSISTTTKFIKDLTVDLL